ncbi:small multi-drug export protein [Nocardiopsis sp. CC223A]|uniref:small multi-drug export protein n=1 Tax=Nocardiopsis sp. CC223A TaxID=3044051 RepID=UPI00278BB320|nr:small multi-drug export protein [Nocardiopsis sp. CC223A]
MIEFLQDFTTRLPVALQWAVVVVLGMIPFVESYSGAALGVVAGLPVYVAVPAAVAGNIVSMLFVVSVAARLRNRVRGNRTETALSPRRAKLRKRFDRYGVAGVALLGPLALPSQITAAATVSFGASRRAVVFWQAVAIVLWGVGFGTLATLGVAVLA